MVTTSKDITANPAVCPSGECTFDQYTTLALCHSTEDVTSQLRDGSLKTEGPTGFGGNASFWASTIFSSMRGDIGGSGPVLNISEDSLEHGNSKMNDLAHIYLTYQDPCLERKTDVHTSLDPNKSHTYKATFRMCLQTRSTNFNVSTSTRVDKTHIDLPWENSQNAWSVRLDNDSEGYRISDRSIYTIGSQFAKSFNVSGTFSGGPVNYLYGIDSGSSLATDIIGPNPGLCPNATGYGFEGFTRRMEHIAAKITDA